MKIGIIGCGYVGISIAISMALKGFECICCDIDKTKIAKLNKGMLTFYEKGLDELFVKTQKNMSFTININNVVNLCDIIYIAVGTPSNASGRCNINYVRDVVMKINNMSNSLKTIIVKSTCEVGTMDKLITKVNQNITLIFSPEFLAQGEIVQNITKPSRLVFGLKNNDEKILKILYKLYAYEIKNNVKMIITDFKTAELAKYSCNAFLAMKISFINKISQLCEALGANILDVEQIMKLDCRIGPNYLESSLGFGGSCFDKDLKALISIMRDYNIKSKMITNILSINNEQIDCAVSIINKHKKSNKILILGTTFKKDTNDITNSPALNLITKLIENKYSVAVYDCIKVDFSNYKYVNNIIFEKNLEKAIKNYDDIVIGCDWEQFKTILNFPLNTKNIYDFKRIFEFNTNINIFGIGKKN